MKKILVFLIVGLFLIGGVIAPGLSDSESFCGTSSYGICNSNSDCFTDGCNGEVCKSINDEETTISTTCVALSCFDTVKFNKVCTCLNSQCQWAKKTQEISSNKVCCHKFGYGSGMEIVNSQYVYIDKESCVTPEDFVGGGREVVDNSYCVNQVKERVKERIQARINDSDCPNDCTCSGSVTKCEFAGGRQMTIMAGKSGNMVVQMKGVNMSTKVELYKNENGSLVGVFRGKERVINFDPDQAREKIRERLKQQTCECDEMELDDDGNYNVEARKRARLFFVVPVKEKVKLQVDSETGEITRIRTSWWGFLAKDKIEDVSTE